jgi:predicted anti-sigma-YlaC factor YlaD
MSHTFARAGLIHPGADCTTTRMHLHEFVDDELDTGPCRPVLRALLVAHLTNCQGCARLERQLQILSRRLRVYAQRTATCPDELPSPAFRERITRMLSG